jgi:hypothetical protein
MCAMEAGRTRWTDERLDDLALGVRDDIRELRLEMREFRSEMREEFRCVRGEIANESRGFRGEFANESRGLRGEIAEIRVEAGMNRRLLMGMWMTTLLGFAGLIVETGLR